MIDLTKCYCRHIKNMKRTLGFILCLMIPFMVLSQKNPFYVVRDIPDRDSLLAIIEKSNNDLVLMNAYRELGFIYYENKRDSAQMYFEKIIVLSKNKDRKLWEADASNSIGFISYTQGNYPRALQFLLQAKSNAEDPSSENNTWDPADTSYVSPHIARLTVLCRTHNHLASLYGYAGDFKDNVTLELFHFRESLRLAILIQDKRMESIVNMNIGRHYSHTDDLDSVLHYGNIALALIEETGYTRYKGSLLSYIGNAYGRQKKYDLARTSYLKAVKASQEIYNLRSLADSYLALSNLSRLLGAIDSSLYYGKMAELNYQITTIPSGIAYAYASLSASYHIKNEIDSAFKYQALALKVRENMSTEEKLKQFQNMRFDERLRVEQLEKYKEALQNRIITYSLLTGITIFMLIAFILFKNNQNRKKANTLLEQQKTKVEETLFELTATQAQLIQSEKMASLGELTAGIAHEIQNPLNFVNNFASINAELIDEMRVEMDKGNNDEVKALANDIFENEQKIMQHGKRAESIVKGMLQHSRKSTGAKEPTDINALADEYMRLAYHARLNAGGGQGLRAKDKSFNSEFKMDLDPILPLINVIPQDIGRLFLNLFNNAFWAVNEKKKLNIEGYEPLIIVSTKVMTLPSGLQGVEIKVVDNGSGIPAHIIDKIFQPFFTTKPTGQGTGLGLSLAYDIVKAHSGSIAVDSSELNGTTFTILIPI